MSRRLARWAFIIASVLSLALFLATCALWARSSWHTDGVRRVGARHGHIVFAARGILVWQVLERNAASASPPAPEWVLWSDRPTRPSEVKDVFRTQRHHFWWAGFGWCELDPLPPMGGMSMPPVPPKDEMWAVPLWAIATAAAVLPACRIVLARRSRRRRRTSLECPNCGYDLRATPDRCPECGRERSGATTAGSRSA